MGKHDLLDQPGISNHRLGATLNAFLKSHPRPQTTGHEGRETVLAQFRKAYLEDFAKDKAVNGKQKDRLPQSP